MKQAAATHAGGAGDLVELAPDHPGFTDAAYRARRNTIARLALEYSEGQPVPRAEYTEAEHEVWRTVWQSLAPLHDRYACREYRSCAELVHIDRTRIPQLAEINDVVRPMTGFRMLPVAGLVSSRTFLGYLGKDVFLATQYIRHVSRPFYTPEPDIVHELVGHAATFCHPGFAELNRHFGRAAARADQATLRKIERLYWYTLEFGVVLEGEALKVYGAGLLSSFGELGGFERDAKLRALDPAEIVETPYDPTSYQKTLFVAPSFDAMSGTITAWLDAT